MTEQMTEESFLKDTKTCRRDPATVFEGGEKKTGPMAWETIDVSALP